MNVNIVAQYYTPAGLNAIESGRIANEGDMYLDTINNDLRIGLTHGKLGSIADNQEMDSVILYGDSLKLYIENGNYASVDVSDLKVKGALVGDIKSGIQNADHKGWYIMDGRMLTLLPLIAQVNAASLGVAGNLPDASNRTMKTKTGVEALFSTGGSATHTLTQVNMPLYNMPSATTSSAGLHSHTATIDSAGEHSHSTTSQNLEKALKKFSNSGANSDSALVEGGSNPFVTDANGAHNHTIIVNSGGVHTHTVTANTGGSGTPFNLYQPYFIIRRFIYLGQ
jgi:hypothetical protein